MKKYYINYSYSCETLPDILPPAKRIIAIGDVHGDVEVVFKSLKLAKVIDYDDEKLKNIKNEDNLEWIKWTAEPPNTIVVQVGDQLDNCRPLPNNMDNCMTSGIPDVFIMKIFDKINEKAMEYGGAVYSLLGNHEIMNVMGEMQYVAKSGFEYFDNKKNRIDAFKPGSEYAKYLACTRQTGIIIGSNLFVHAGILPQLAKKYTISDINKFIRKWLLNEITADTYLDGIKLKDLLESYTLSPFWPRLLGDLPNNINIYDERCADLIETLNCYKINNMIIGHTPQFYKNHAGINITCKNKNNHGIWRIDVGASNAFDAFASDEDDRKIQVLEIIDDSKFRIIK